jgi:hypothetical protein
MMEKRILRSLVDSVCMIVPQRVVAGMRSAVGGCGSAMTLMVAPVAALLLVSETARGDDFVVVTGAGGETEYSQFFSKWAADWVRIADESGSPAHLIGGDANASANASDDASNGDTAASDKALLIGRLDRLATDDPSPVWIVLIGHGTYQQGVAKFNLRGPDVSDAELATCLDQISDRPLVVINCASSSGPFLARLSGQGRIVITATRSGDEQNFAYFGQFLADAIGQASSDLDHDRRVSILEAFLSAASATEEFYRSKDRLMTEHPLIDDNGDAKGTPPQFYRGIRVVQKAASSDVQPDGATASRTILWTYGDQPQLTEAESRRVAELEQELESMRGKKETLSADDYFRAIEPLLLELATIESP